MKKIITIFGYVWEKLLVLGGVLYVLLPTSPLNMPFTYADSGVFHYIGWRILNGDIPYKDVWDHKPPVIFYINALGQSIIDHPRWGIWVLELIFLFFTFFIAYKIIKQHFGTYSAIVSIMLGFITLPFLIHGGNFTEEYAMLWYFLALLLFVSKKFNKNSILRWFLIGVLGGLAFFTKQTTIGLWIAIFVYITYSRLRDREILSWFRQIGSMISGALLIAGIIVVYFLAHDALREFWDAAFAYNFFYSSDITQLAYRLRPLLVGIKPLVATGIFQLSLLGFGIGLLSLNRLKNGEKTQTPLIIVLLVDFPIEVLLVSVSGQYPTMYYMTLLPVLIMLVSIFIHQLFSLIVLNNSNLKQRFVLLVIIMVSFIWSTIYDYRNEVDSLSHMKSTIIIDYIKENSDADDYILGWGAESFLNYFSERESPSRYVYQFPLYRASYANEARVNEFLDAIITKRPKLIIDNKRPDAPIFDFPVTSSAIEEKLSFLKSEYSLSTTMTDNLGLWEIYELKED